MREFRLLWDLVDSTDFAENEIIKEFPMVLDSKRVFQKVIIVNTHK